MLDVVACTRPAASLGRHVGVGDRDAGRVPADDPDIVVTCLQTSDVHALYQALLQAPHVDDLLRAVHKDGLEGDVPEERRLRRGSRRLVVARSIVHRYLQEGRHELVRAPDDRGDVSEQDVLDVATAVPRALHEDAMPDVLGPLVSEEHVLHQHVPDPPAHLAAYGDALGVGAQVLQMDLRARKAEVNTVLVEAALDSHGVIAHSDVAAPDGRVVDRVQIQTVGVGREKRGRHVEALDEDVLGGIEVRVPEGRVAHPQVAHDHVLRVHELD
mmetsp:Transcript_58688/g.117434  ORF Transcript_58688/g.117434 Transcript_58688/m.117434 type:complete len:271 (+) Transcript_58688:102-914(+)